MGNIFFVSSIFDGVISAHLKKPAADAARAALVKSPDQDVFFEVLSYDEALRFTCHEHLNRLAAGAQ